jgi:transcriptional regulator with XRE-family HTH domain
MRNLTITAGEMLRALRRRRNLTLAQAARLLHTSAPVLSRKERGGALERADLHAAIDAYELDPWESYQLITAAGFLPGSFSLTDGSGSVRRFAESVLANIVYPAFITDELVYVRAWNQPMQIIYSLAADGRPVHLIDILFSETVRTRLGASWTAYSGQAVRIFQLKTLNVRPRADYARLIQAYETKYGPEFTSIWESADAVTQMTVTGLSPQTGIETVTVHHESPLGAIDYLVTNAAWHFPQPYELNVYVPYGAANAVRYADFGASLGTGSIYLAPGGE